MVETKHQVVLVLTYQLWRMGKKNKKATKVHGLTTSLFLSYLIGLAHALRWSLSQVSYKRINERKEKKKGKA
eukprot:scaffold23853_cov127-Cylindrotheca_fusiformis.AAC.1